MIAAPGLNSLAGTTRPAPSELSGRTHRRRRIRQRARGIHAGDRAYPDCQNRGGRQRARRFCLGAPGFSPDLVVFEELDVSAALAAGYDDR
jgi:hypothetical protein